MPPVYPGGLVSTEYPLGGGGGGDGRGATSADTPDDKHKNAHFRRVVKRKNNNKKLTRINTRLSPSPDPGLISSFTTAPKP